MKKEKLEQIIREETAKLKLEEGWKDIAMAGGMALGSLLPGQDASAAIPKEPTTQVQNVADPLLIDDSKWDVFQLTNLFLDPSGGLSVTGEKELASLNQVDDSGNLTTKAELDRKTLFKNPEAAPLQMTTDNFIGSLMDPRPVRR